MKRLLTAVVVLIVLACSVQAHAFPAREVYLKSADAVVLIAARNPGGTDMVGAGSVIKSSGLVITNAHVVIDKRSSMPYSDISVFRKPAEVTGDLDRDLLDRHGARVMAYDTSLDLALLMVYGLPRGQKVIELADPEDVGIGEEVVAIGHPEQGGLWSLTYGLISGMISDQSGVKGKDVYQTDTSVNRGNSGGPLLDRRGYMVGINTNIARMGSGNMAITGVNFAIKSEVVRRWLKGKDVLVSYGSMPVDEGTGAAAGGGPDDTMPVAINAPGSEEAEEPRIIESEAPEEPKEPKSQEPIAPKAPQGLAPQGQAPQEQAPKGLLTPQRPYDYSDLWEEVERDMQDMMDEMRQKIRGR